MQFAAPLPWWLAAIAVAAIVGAAIFSYRRTPVPLAPRQRATLVGLRALTLGCILFFLCRPVVLMPPDGAGGIVVPVLVDVSRSMGVADADGQTRIARAADVVERDLLPALSRQFTPEVYAVGEGLLPAPTAGFRAEARRSELGAALAAVQERYRGRQISGIVLLSDGGDTGQEETGLESGGAPIFTIGIGSPAGLKDREVLGMAAGDPRLDHAFVDLRVSVVAHGYGLAPFNLALVANGRVVESRRVVPDADGSPANEVFSVPNDPVNPTVYSAQIEPAPDEAIAENNRRSVLVSPPGPKRRVLLVQGAPAFEHSFLARTLAHDPGLDIDSVVRKGANDTGQSTFVVQAGGGRAASLSSGFPASREALYGYDLVVIANVEGDFFTHLQLQLVADFVSERGGGLLVLGGRSFAEHGLVGTPLETVIPVELDARNQGLTAAAFGVTAPVRLDAVMTTPAGEAHPIMRLGDSASSTRERWAAMPTLAASAPLGGPRPGATVLAVTAAPGGTVHPVIAVQRYGRGRSMVFGGEASWRWRMMLPSADRSYEFFWRQATRWLAAAAPDPVAITVPEWAEPGDVVEFVVDARDAAFAPASDARLEATLMAPGGVETPVVFRRDAASNGRFLAVLRPDAPGLYRIAVQASRGTTSLGVASRAFYVGGSDREFADPSLNEAFLRRAARQSGGRYVRAAGASEVVSWMKDVAPKDAAPERRDLWHEPWTFTLVIALLAGEWTLRRRWGLR